MKFFVVLGMAALASAAGLAGAEEAPKSDPYTLDTCPVSGKKLGAMGDPVVKEYDGREVRFCCTECPEKFEKDKAGFLKKIDEAIVKQQKPRYPLDTCVVSGEKFGGDMGEPVDYVHDNRLVRFCCKNCIKKFTKEPAKYLTKLDEAVIAKQKPTYPLEACPVSGDKLGGEMGKPVDRVFGGRLVRFCCKDCDKDFRKDPAKFLAKIDEAAKAKGRSGQGLAPTSGKEAATAKGEKAPSDAGGKYVCGMDGGERATQGPCPKCGMQLGPKDFVKTDRSPATGPASTSAPVYECRSCGSTDSRPGNCCGQPMVRRTK